MRFRHPAIVDGAIEHPVHGHIPIVDGVLDAPKALGDELRLAPIVEAPDSSGPQTSVAEPAPPLAEEPIDAGAETLKPFRKAPRRGAKG